MWYQSWWLYILKWLKSIVLYPNNLKNVKIKRKINIKILFSNQFNFCISKWICFWKQMFNNIHLYTQFCFIFFPRSWNTITECSCTVLRIKWFHFNAVQKSKFFFRLLLCIYIIKLQNYRGWTDQLVYIIM